MAVVRNAANTVRRGRIGETTYYVSNGQQIARQARNDSNYGETARRSEAQQSRRVLWANIVNFYKASSSWMAKAFETKRNGQTDYNKFMQVNVGAARINLTREQAAAGACVADNFIVSQGSLPSVEMTLQLSSWVTNINLGNLVIGDSTTNAEFTAAIESNNANLRRGMQLSFVSYQQTVDALGIPRLISRLYEITLDAESQSIVRNYLPVFCSTTIDGKLGTNSNLSIGGFAYIVSDLSSGTLRVSTQRLNTINAALIAQYTSQTQKDAAIASYGLDAEVVLSPVGTNPQTPEGQPLYIEYINVFSGVKVANSYVGNIEDLMNDALTVVVSSEDFEGTPSAIVYAENGPGLSVGVGSVSGRELSFSVPESVTVSGAITKVVVNFVNTSGATLRTLSIPFRTTE